MTRAEVVVTGEGRIKGFRISGHSGAGDSGEDIVCAAISSAAYLTANTVTEVIHADAIAEAEDGYFYLSVAKKDLGRCADVLNGLKLHLLSLEEQYPENLNVFYLEV